MPLFDHYKPNVEISLMRSMFGVSRLVTVNVDVDFAVSESKKKGKGFYLTILHRNCKSTGKKKHYSRGRNTFFTSKDYCSFPFYKVTNLFSEG